MSQNTKNVEPEYKDEGQILKPSTTEHPLYGKIVDACKTVYDPEIPVNIYDLGLIYTVEISDENDAKSCYNYSFHYLNNPTLRFSAL